MTTAVIGIRQDGGIEYAHIASFGSGNQTPETARSLLIDWGEDTERALSLVRMGELWRLGPDDLTRNRDGARSGRIKGESEAYIRFVVREWGPELAALFDADAGGWLAWKTIELKSRNALRAIIADVRDGQVEARRLRTAFESTRRLPGRTAGTQRSMIRREARDLAGRYDLIRKAMPVQGGACSDSVAKVYNPLEYAARAREIRDTAAELARAEAAAEQAFKTVHAELLRTEDAARNIPGAGDDAPGTREGGAL